MALLASTNVKFFSSILLITNRLHIHHESLSTTDHSLKKNVPPIIVHKLVTYVNTIKFMSSPLKLGYCNNRKKIIRSCIQENYIKGKINCSHDLLNFR